MNIYKQPKFTFKITIEFSFLRIRVDSETFKPDRIWNENNYIRVDLI